LRDDPRMEREHGVCSQLDRIAIETESRLSASWPLSLDLRVRLGPCRLRRHRPGAATRRAGRADGSARSTGGLRPGRLRLRPASRRDRSFRRGLGPRGIHGEAHRGRPGCGSRRRRPLSRPGLSRARRVMRELPSRSSVRLGTIRNTRGLAGHGGRAPRRLTGDLTANRGRPRQGRSFAPRRWGLLLNPWAPPSTLQTSRGS
jgi:hypothetical protein